MSNSKISALTSATTPLAGTEILPVVQSSTTKQVSVANLTAGRDVSASGLFVDANSATNAIRITQTGAGNALLVEDSASPDSTPFAILGTGATIVGYTTTVATANYANTGITPLLEIQGTSASTSAVGLYNWSTSSASSSTLAFSKSVSGTIGTVGAISVLGTDLGNIAFLGDDGTNFVPAASILAELDGTPGTNDMPGRLSFATTADGASTPTERVRIDNAGNTYVETGAFWQYAPAPTALAAGANAITAAQLQGSIFTAAQATAVTMTLPLATAIDTYFPSVPTTNIGFDLYVVNTGSALGAVTVAVNTGITNVGSLTVAITTSAHFRLRRTAANTYVLYRLS